MRVKRTLVTMLVMLLALGVLAPAAGAIYIEGQTIPDDGMMHIMSADMGTGEAAPAGMPADIDIPAGALPSYVLGDSSFAGLPSGFPASVMLPFEGMASSPAADVPSEIADPSSGIIEKQLPPVATGLWNFFDTGSMPTNLPTSGNLFF